MAEILSSLLEECRKLDYSQVPNHTSFQDALLDMQGRGLEAVTFPIADIDWLNVLVPGRTSLSRYADMVIFEVDREVTIMSKNFQGMLSGVLSGVLLPSIMWPAGVPLPVVWMPQVYLRGPPSAGKWVYLANDERRDTLRDHIHQLVYGASTS
jgi:hypothetical protein